MDKSRLTTSTSGIGLNKGILRDFVSSLHQSTVRDYLARMVDDKVYCMERAKLYDFDYWDGDRRFGYGGYRYIPGRWTPVAEAIIAQYGLSNFSRLLDVGCGKGYLLYEIKKLLPNIQIQGFDCSEYALKNSKAEIAEYLFWHRAELEYPFATDDFDLVLSLGCLHNLRLPQLITALSEIQRVGKNAYVMVESYRNEQELTNLQCWALTAESYFDVDEWLWIYNMAGFTGDYEFIFFE